MLRPGKDKGLATPIPLGLAALGSTTFLMGIAMIFQPLTAWSPYLIQALMFGGLIEILAGMWAFAYGDVLAAAAFSFLGAFFGWWGLVHLTFLGVHAAALATVNSVATVFIVAGVVTLYLWVASFYEFAAFNLTLLFLWLAFGLVGIAMYTGVVTLGVIGGIGAVISGLIAAYTSFAEIYNAASFQEVVPLGEPITIRRRAEEDEMERIRRTHPMNHGEEKQTIHS
jgi:uncharacterized protein